MSDLPKIKKEPSKVVVGIPFQPGMIPGYEEAVELEQRNRSGSFIEASENVKGFSLCKMTLGQFDLLRFLKNPLLFQGIPSLPQLFEFVWLLNPHYLAQDASERRGVIKALKPYYEPSPPIMRTAIRLYFHHQKRIIWLKRWSELIAALHNYVEEQFYDSPGFAKGKSKSYFCDVAGFVDTFSSEYGWTRGEILSMPLKQIFQLHKAIAQRKGCKTMMNRSEDVIGAAVTKGIHLKDGRVILN